MASRIITPVHGNSINIRSSDILTVCMDDCIFYEAELDVELLPGSLRFVDASGHGYRGLCND